MNAQGSHRVLSTFGRVAQRTLERLIAECGKKLVRMSVGATSVRTVDVDEGFGAHRSGLVAKDFKFFDVSKVHLYVPMVDDASVKFPAERRKEASRVAQETICPGTGRSRRRG